jgi:ATP-binding protein involved in chromosome partitioning
MSNHLTQNEIKSLLEPLIDIKMLSNIIFKDSILTLIIDIPSQETIDQENITKKIETLLYAECREAVEIRIIFNKNKPIQNTAAINKPKTQIPNVKKIILFASAKGGVGKSTTATNTALAFAKLGFSVGLVDADIYGPTIPKLLGIKQQPIIKQNKMLPIFKYGIYSISIGNLIDENQATIWRGPMTSKALYQLLLGVDWPELDYLIIDMPPGTGDIYLSLAENFLINGVVLLSTPQNIALTMLKKSLAFFYKTNIPILGIIENMSYFVDEENQVKHNIFGENLSQEDLKAINLDLLEQIPLITKISNYSDKGLSMQHEKEFAIYCTIAKKVSEKLKELS